MLSKKERNWLFAVVLVASISSSMLQTALTTALPVIMSDLSVSASTAQWLTSAYSLAMGIMVPSTAFLMRRFSTRKLFLGALLLFAVGTLIVLLSSNFTLLLFGRILQAMGNGIILPMTQVIILTIYPIEKRGFIMGIYGLAAGAAPVIAPTLAGIIIDVWNWRAIFVITLFIIVVNLLLAFKVMKNITETEKIHFDFLSMFLCTIGFSGIIIGLGNISSLNLLVILVPILIGVISLILFSKRQLNLSHPFLELRTLKNKNYLLAVIISMLLYAVMMGGSTLFPIYIQEVMGESATTSGLIMMPGSLVMAIISPFTGVFYDKLGIRKLVIFGSVLMFLSCLGVTFVNQETSIIYIVVCYILRLISIGCIMMPIVTWGMSGLDSYFTSHGTALLTALRTISGALGSAVFVAVMTYFTNLSNSGLSASSYGVDIAFIGMTVLAGVQMIVAIGWVGK